ncbi:MAG: SPOR domain-containing protein [Bradyrhizobium sp.]
MADRYQDRAFAGDGFDRDTRSHASANPEGDPLAELARLIGQTDPFGSRPIGRANLPVQPQARPVDREPSYDNHEPSYDRYAEPESDEGPVPAPPSWMQRAARQEAPPPPPQQDEYPSAVHPLHRYAAEHPPAEPDYDPEQLFADTPHEPHEPDLSRYDEALYGGFDSATQQTTQHDQGYADDSYAYEEDQDFEAPEPRRRGGMITVAAVLALAVFGVGGALAYRNYTGGARNGEPPIIRADAAPTKIVPAPADAGTKVPDRMTAGDGTEKIVSREETPLDPNARSGPRVVFPPLTPNGSVPLPTTVVPGTPPPANGATAFSNNEPHAVKTFTVRSDQAASGVPAAAVPPAAAPAKLPPRPAGTNARASAANPNAPLSLSPQAESPAAPEPQRMASNAPTQVAPSVPSAAGSGSYLVSITSQPSEAEAQASYRALQGKYPSVLGSQSPVVARANSKSGTATYRAGVAFGTSAEASQFCHNYAAAGGQCWVVRN